MPNEPKIEILSKGSRSALFFLLLAVFLVALPVMIFYTTGYRLNLDNSDNRIVTTGGMYITSNTLEVDVYVNEEKIDKPRLFRSAYYIQNIEAGMKRIVVQRPDLSTWVKELPVDSRIVIEASAFNMPLLPNVRPITEFVTSDEVPVFFGTTTAANLFSKSTSTVTYLSTTTVATSTFEINEEYIFVNSLFGTSTRSSVFDQLMDEVDRFRFATTTERAATTTEEIVERGDIRLVDRKGEIYAVWQNGVNNIPYYFCVQQNNYASTSERFGTHVAEAIFGDNVATSTTLVDNERTCRSEIKLNHLAQDVFFYDFFPDSTDLILLQLEDGLYVTEIDDRAWQNTQMLYPGNDFKVVVENGVIYLNENNLFFEVFTEVEPE